MGYVQITIKIFIKYMMISVFYAHDHAAREVGMICAQNVPVFFYCSIRLFFPAAKIMRRC